MKIKFPMPKTISSFMGIIGYLVLMAGIYFLIFRGIIEPGRHSSGAYNWNIQSIITGGICVLSSLFIMAYSEIINVFLNIETNTRKAMGKDNTDTGSH